MLMCNNHISGAITISISTTFVVLVIIFVIVTSNFFTNDEIKRYTIEKATIKAETVSCMYEENISDKIIEQNENTIQNEGRSSTEMIEQSTTISKDSNTKKSNAEKSTTSKSTSTSTTAKVNTTVNKIETNTNKTKTESSKNLEQMTVPPSECNGLATIGKIEIPKTGINMPIYSKVSVKGMNLGPCLLYSTGEINKSGSSLIVGHNYNGIFGKNKNLQIGDKIYVTTLDGNRIAYTVYNKIFVTPDDLSYMNTNNTQIAISTCTSDDNCRLVVLAKI